MLKILGTIVTALKIHQKSKLKLKKKKKKIVFKLLTNIKEMVIKLTKNKVHFQTKI